MEEILQRLAQEDAGLADPTTLPPLQARELAEQANGRWNIDLPPMLQIDDVDIQREDGTILEGRLFTPEHPEQRLIYFVHGGGFSLCSIETHERAARLLAHEAKCAVLSLAYRLAPENPYPAGLNDCIQAFRQLKTIQNRYPWTKGPTAIAGDSSGANLALSMILHEQSLGHPSPDFAMLFYGVYGTNFQTRSYMDFEFGPGLTRAKMMRYLDWYAPMEVRGTPLVSPLSASDEALSGLPPLYLNAAEIDPLCTDTEDLATRLRALGRQDQVRVYKGVVHGFMQMTTCLPAACEATSEAANAFRKFAGK